jgi:hypothetical protein
MVGQTNVIKNIYHGPANTNQMPTAIMQDIVCCILTLFCLDQWRHEPRGPTKYLLAQREQRAYEEVCFVCTTPSVVLMSNARVPKTLFLFAHIADWPFCRCFQMMRNRPPKSPEQKKQAKEEVHVTPREFRSGVCSCERILVLISQKCVQMLDVKGVGG